MRFAFIVNPAAGRGVGARVAAAIRARMEEAGVAYVLHLTRHAEEARRKASEAARESEYIVAVGGDGTLHHVVRGLVAGQGSAGLGVVPVGTGNDFAKMIGMPSRATDAIEALLKATPHACDYACVRWREGEAEYERPFTNVLGIGIDAVVAREVGRLTALPGLLRYVVAALRELPRYRAPEIELAVDGGGASFSGKLLLLSIGNGATAGGGFRLTPDAALDDGLLDYCLVPELRLLRALILMPRAVAGRHVTAPEVTVSRARTMQIRSDGRLPVHADGEYLTSAASELSVRIVPAGLQVLRPG